MDQLEPLIRPDFRDYGVLKFRALCDAWGGAGAFASALAFLARARWRRSKDSLLLAMSAPCRLMYPREAGRGDLPGSTQV